MTYSLRGRFKRTYMGQRSVSAQQTSRSSVSPIMHTACYSSPPPLAPHKFLSLLEDTLFDSDSTKQTTTTTQQQLQNALTRGARHTHETSNKEQEKCREREGEKITYDLRGRFKRTYMGQRSVSAQQTEKALSPRYAHSLLLPRPSSLVSTRRHALRFLLSSQNYYFTGYNHYTRSHAKRNTLTR